MATVYDPEKGLTDSGGAAISKMVRLPLGHNLKEGKDNFKIRLVELHPERVFGMEELLEGWGLTLLEKKVWKKRENDVAFEGVDPLFNWLQENGKIIGERGEVP
jgi:hypothetical protein